MIIGIFVHFAVESFFSTKFNAYSVALVLLYSLCDNIRKSLNFLGDG